MSLILDALNRAEHERKNKNAVPDINTVHTPAIPPAPQPVAAKPVMILIAISLLVIAIILIIWLFRSSSISLPVFPEQTSNTQQTNNALANTAQMTTAPQATTPMETESLAAESQAKDSASPDTIPPQPASSEVTAAAPAIENLYAEKSADVTVPDTSVEKLYEPEIAEPVSESIVTPFEPVAQNNAADIEAVNALAQQAMGQPVDVQPPEQLITGATAKPQRRYEEINVQEFNSLAWNQKQQIPTISYSRHNYLPQNVSTVVINGETVGEGNAFGGGSFVVDEIFVDGVVLSFRGNKFKLRALSGWVNM